MSPPLRSSANRRVHVVELTALGKALSFRLRDASIVFDRRLRCDITDDDLAGLQDVLDKLAQNMDGLVEACSPWAGQIEN